MLKQSCKLYKLVSNAQKLIDQGYYVPNQVRENIPKLSDQLAEGFTVIGEIKPASPSQGRMFPDRLLEKKIKLIANNTDAISVLTEPNYFGGSLENIDRCIEFDKPILMKDIIIDERQIEAGINASSILLIKRLLETSRIEELTTHTRKLGLETILEVDNKNDFEICLDIDVDIIAINNRNLENFKLDRKKSLKILEEYQPDHQILTFSGYRTPEDVIAIANAGAAGVLIGTALSEHNRPDILLREIRATIKRNF